MTSACLNLGIAIIAKASKCLMDSSLTNNKMVQNVIREGLKLLGTNRVAGFGQEILNLGADQFGYGVFGGCVSGCLRQWFELD